VKACIFAMLCGWVAGALSAGCWVLPLMLLFAGMEAGETGMQLAHVQAPS